MRSAKSSGFRKTVVQLQIFRRMGMNVLDAPLHVLDLTEDMRKFRDPLVIN